MKKLFNYLIPVYFFSGLGLMFLISENGKLPNLIQNSFNTINTYKFSLFIVIAIPALFIFSKRMSDKKSEKLPTKAEEITIFIVGFLALLILFSSFYSEPF